MSIERRTDVSVKQSQGHHIGATVLLGRTGDHESKMKTGIRSDFMEDSEWRGQHKAAWELNVELPSWCRRLLPTLQATPRHYVGPRRSTQLIDL